MTEVILDGKEIHNRAGLHAKLAAELHFPAWYGSNLDALYDCLTDIHEDTRLVLANLDELEENLGDYAERLYRVLSRAEADNPWLMLAGKRE